MEWKNGSFEEELRREKYNNVHFFRGFSYDMFNEYGNLSSCPLLKIHWLRLIVDEGHTMGKRGQPTNAIDFASWIFAERRWAMTGTPTPQSIDKDGLGNLFGLLKFLKHHYFTAEHWGEEVSNRYNNFERSKSEKTLSVAFCLSSSDAKY